MLRIMTSGSSITHEEFLFFSLPTVNGIEGACRGSAEGQENP